MDTGHVATTHHCLQEASHGLVFGSGWHDACQWLPLFTLDLADDLGDVLDLTRTDVFKLGLRLVQRHLDSLLERSEPISDLVTRHVPSLKRFDAALGRYSAGGRSELASIWRDFDAVQRIEIAGVRNDALDNLKERLVHLFNRAKKERVPLPPMIVEVDLA